MDDTNQHTIDSIESTIRTKILALLELFGQKRKLILMRNPDQPAILFNFLKLKICRCRFDTAGPQRNQYQLRCVNLGGIVLYDGYESGFEFRTAKSTATYEFELLAIDEQENKLIIDRKSLIVEAQPDLINFRGDKEKTKNQIVLNKRWFKLMLRLSAK
ncbi:hypothetical protein BpHYR1_002004 [Brachionus plicatilis]|uniref:Uncharacterized protein n=1 Tax=Brachionus plicatilis TaxID=10195 RepID=A0A3M7SPQ6_BRAPC|nr:hypothetical protein BpHYR1_002004 [Brachionus plicatilis]